VTAIPQLKGVEHRHVNARGLRMHVAETGDGPPVLLLHGWPQHWWCWRHVIPLLADRHRVIAVDLRGQGWTDAPAGGYEKDVLASDVLALLDALEIDSVRLIGHDWGGLVGFLLCLRAPARFERYLALNTGHPWPSADPRNLLSLPRFAYQLPLSAPVAGPWLIRTQADRLIEHALRGNAVRKEAFTDEDLRIFAERLRDPARARASALLYRTFLLSDQAQIARGRHRSERLRTPTLMLHGTCDPVLRPHMLKGYEAHADDMRVELVADAGHFIAEDRPHLVAARALRLFATG
jgi:pimeloyl-ACP methyl ester carboxylesterase